MSIPPCRDIWDIVNLATARRSGLVEPCGVSDGRLLYRLTPSGEGYRDAKPTSHDNDISISIVLAKYKWAYMDDSGAILDRRRDDIIIDGPSSRNASRCVWRTPLTPALRPQYAATLDDAINLVDWEAWNNAPDTIDDNGNPEQ